ncbi:MAG: tubulin-like doman-containing protein, partial [Coriobacteriaceae bacterium]|nr:tubulin-like doman-containing protein [Coriobacteriaceae bacterium]
GISGGTGAGTFLDVCYLVRTALSLEGADAFTCGYFFLPDVNLSRGLDTQTAAYVQDNGYAAMQELDYCTNFESNGDKWSQYYSGVGLVENSYPPVDLCHLVTANDANGNVIPDAYKYAMNVVSEYFMDFLAANGNDNSFTLNSHISNFAQRKANINKGYGALYEYCVLGTSSATLPFKEVLTYLAAAMFRSFEGMRSYNPTKAQVEEFVARNALRYDALFAQLTQNCDMTFPQPDVKWQDAKGNDDLTVTYFKDHQARVENFLERNYKAMSRDLDGYAAVAENPHQNAARSLVAKVLTALRAVAADPDRGPYHAAGILRSTAGGDLLAVIDGHIAEARAKYEQENAQADKLQRAWEQAQRDFFENANALNGKTKYQKYRDATRHLVIHFTRLALFTKMFDLMDCFRKQLVKLADGFTDVLRDTTGKLIDTFAANRDYLELAAGGAPAYEFPLARIQDLQDELDATIKAMNIRDKAADFLQMLLSEEGVKAWTSSNENNLTSLVNKYFTTLFSAYSLKTMTSYLQDKYNTEDPNLLIKNIRDDIMNLLDSRATPLFWTSPLYPLNSASVLGYITLPNTCAEVVAAAQDLAQAQPELVVRGTEIQDRISIMRCLVGVPLFGYQGLLQYERSSLDSVSVGKHLYEGRDYINDNGQPDKGRDWRVLPSPLPVSLMNEQSPPSLWRAANDAIALYEKAEEKQVIVNLGANDYGIKVIAERFSEGVRAAYADAIGKPNEVKLEASAKIAALLENVEYEPVATKIPNDGAQGMPEMNKRLIRVDHFASAPKLQEIATAELAKHVEFDKMLEELEPKADTDLDGFFNALFTGVFRLALPLIDHEDEFGEKTVLSSPDMQRGGVPLWQAFLNYKELEEYMLVAIKAKSDALLQTSPVPETVAQACRTLSNELGNPSLIKFMIEEANQNFPHETKDLREFITKIREAHGRFVLRYRIDLL